MLRRLHIRPLPRRPWIHFLLDKSDNDFGHVFDVTSKALLVRLHLNRIDGQFTAPKLSYSGGLALRIPVYRTEDRERYLPLFGKSKATEKRIIWVLFPLRKGTISIKDRVGQTTKDAKTVTTSIDIDKEQPAPSISDVRARIDRMKASAEPAEVPRDILVSIEQYERKHGEGAASLEARILLYALNAANFREIRRNLRRLAKLRAAEDNDAAFRAFFDEVNRRIAPLGVGRHGYWRLLKDGPEQGVLAAMQSLISDIEAHGYKVFINSGTLLGYVRSGKPIPYDDDIDFAIYYGEVTAAEAAQRQKALFDTLLKKHPDLRPGIFFSFWPKSGTTADFFPSWSENGKFRVFPYLDGEVNFADVQPFKQIDWEGATLSVPSNPEALLAVNYGPDWHIPDPLWQFDWGAARRRFSDFEAQFQQ